MCSRLPLVVILGCTGSGKTKLSLELAKAFGGEIIGADSMQIYKKLDVISAKPTLEERSVAPHHLIDILEPSQTCTVIDYRNKAIPIIDNLMSQNKLPIIAGGTNYYIEALLWKILVADPDECSMFKPWDFRIKNPEISSEELHKKLSAVDAEMAKRLHPNNKRKIIRYLEICERKGKKASEILKEQQSQEGGSSTGGGLRYKNSIILWLQWDQSVLDQRINDRVDLMVKDGLLNELLEFQDSFPQRSDGYNQGMNQMIGPKEFHNFLQLAPEDRDTEVGQEFFAEGVEKLKMVTRRYAKKQIKWMKNRFLGRSDREVPPLYGLKVENVEKWDDQVLNPAIKIIKSSMEQSECDLKPLAKIETNSVSNSLAETYNCDVCERVFVGQFQWDVHLRSRRHRRMLEKRKKSETRQD